MGNIWAANALLGIPVDPEIHLQGNKQDFLEHASKTALELHKQFPKVKTVANTFRFDQGDGGILYYASLDTVGHQYHSTELVASKIVDKVGSGDCFMAGLIYGLYHRNEPQEVIETAAAAAFGKLMEKGTLPARTWKPSKNESALMDKNKLIRKTITESSGTAPRSRCRTSAASTAPTIDGVRIDTALLSDGAGCRSRKFRLTFYASRFDLAQLASR